jgi:uncharacterized protein with beta-barrel porin domain
VASDKDILGKADALLRRNQPRGAVGTDTGGVPVLTDFIGITSSEETAMLAGEVSMQVVATVEARLTTELERRVSEQLSGQIHGAVIAALADLRQDLANAVAEAVTEALARRNVK